MLVLSRKEKERILFPTLGITVEVVRTGANKVQLGIDAPREIRIIRDELNDFAETELRSRSISEFRESEVRCELESAGKSIDRAQKQIRQGNCDQAGEALEQALLSLRQLESQFAAADCKPEPAHCIGESRAGYRVVSKSLAQIVDECLRIYF